MDTTNYINRLPRKVLQNILSELTNVDDLRSAALSCRSLYIAFIDSEEAITKRVIEQQIPSDILPEAILLRNWQCLIRGSSTQSILAGIFVRRYLFDYIHPDRQQPDGRAKYLSERPVLNCPYKLQEILPMGRDYASGLYKAYSLLRPTLLDDESELAFLRASPSHVMSHHRQLICGLYRYRLYYDIVRTGFWNFYDHWITFVGLFCPYEQNSIYQSMGSERL
ncbi:hypothetical protein F5Y11DRAFT_314413 [Daldinia sp. FL1419]|nr:hypothetical protein F5Y11DRAFT_314413 [Daldinia sp. FL1419]